MKISIHIPNRILKILKRYYCHHYISRIFHMLNICRISNICYQLLIRTFNAHITTKVARWLVSYLVTKITINFSIHIFKYTRYRVNGPCFKNIVNYTTAKEFTSNKKCQNTLCYDMN